MPAFTTRDARRWPTRPARPRGRAGRCRRVYWNSGRKELNPVAVQALLEDGVSMADQRPNSLENCRQMVFLTTSKSFPTKLGVPVIVYAGIA